MTQISASARALLHLQRSPRAMHTQLRVNGGVTAASSGMRQQVAMFLLFALGLMVSNIDPALTLLIPALSQLADTHWPSCPFEQGRQCDLQPFSLFLQVFPHCSIRYGAAAANLFSPSSFPPSLLSHVFCGWLPPLM